MINGPISLVRKLREFVDRDLFGLIGWQSVVLVRVGQCDGLGNRVYDDGEECAEIQFSIDGVPCALGIWSPDAKPPVGELRARIGGCEVRGTLATWDTIAAQIRALKSEDVHAA